MSCCVVSCQLIPFPPSSTPDSVACLYYFYVNFLRILLKRSSFLSPRDIVSITVPLRLLHPSGKFTPCRRVLPEKLTSSQLVKKFPAFYGTRMFITTFTSARHLSVSWARLVQPIPSHPTLWRPILMLVSHLRVGIQSSHFSRSPYQNLRTFGCFFHVIPHPFCPLCFRLAFLFRHTFCHGLSWTTRFCCCGPRFAPCSWLLLVSATVSA